MLGKLGVPQNPLLSSQESRSRLHARELGGAGVLVKTHSPETASL